jgi:NADH/NAD ratio-sensing transcriptional regulator Rex
MKYRDIEISAVTVRHIKQLELAIKQTKYDLIGSFVDNDLAQEVAEKQIARHKNTLAERGVVFEPKQADKEGA